MRADIKKECLFYELLNHSTLEKAFPKEELLRNQKQGDLISLCGSFIKYQLD